MSHLGVAAIEAALVGAPDPEMVAREAELRAAQLAGDVAAMDRLIADGLLFTGPEELRVRHVGNDVAVTALRARLAVEVAGTLVRGTYRYTRVWARQDGGPWRVIGGHVSEVPGTGAGVDSGRGATPSDP